MNQFIKDLFCDDNKPDIGKVCILLTITSAISWVTYFMCAHHGVIPDLAGICAFVGTGAGLPKAINHVDDCISAWKNKQQ